MHGNLCGTSVDLNTSPPHPQPPLPPPINPHNLPPIPPPKPYPQSAIQPCSQSACLNPRHHRWHTIIFSVHSLNCGELQLTAAAKHRPKEWPQARLHSVTTRAAWLLLNWLHEQSRDHGLIAINERSFDRLPATHIRKSLFLRIEGLHYLANTSTHCFSALLCAWTAGWLIDFFVAQL